jgi:hypothetical protein
MESLCFGFTSVSCWSGSGSSRKSQCGFGSNAGTCGSGPGSRPRCNKVQFENLCSTYRGDFMPSSSEKHGKICKFVKMRTPIPVHIRTRIRIKKSNLMWIHVGPDSKPYWKVSRTWHFHFWHVKNVRFVHRKFGKFLRINQVLFF